MQKHARKRNASTNDNRSSFNANRVIGADCQKVIVSLTDCFTLDDAEDFAVSYLQSEYLSKYHDEKVTPASERRSRAITKWFSTEAKNVITNRRLRGMDRGYNVLPRVTFYSFLSFAQGLTSRILGTLDDYVALGSFSGGASTSRGRTQSQPAQKFVGKADITEEAMRYLGVIHHVAPLLREYESLCTLNVVPGAKLFTVPKKSDIDRCACKEPDVNMFLQKGVGNHIRRRLKKQGINLNDQSINRKLAHQGSISNAVATLDLSSASDTITVSVVQALLPTDWFEYLNGIRSHTVEVDGEIVRTEMFSSMGNGFTFELESLLFYVLMRTVAYFEGVPGVISVYGDDLIIPSGMYDSAVWILELFGFSINPDKSFHDGPFRESCGGHYYNGVDVTPFYLKRLPTRLTDVIRVCNQFRLWAMADPVRRYAYPAIFHRWRELLMHVPQNLWGGTDLRVDTQAVTVGSSHSKLVRVKRKLNLPETGMYLAWHCTNWNRSSDPDEVGHEPEATETFCRLRKAIPGASVDREEFYEELFPNADSG